MIKAYAEHMCRLYGASIVQKSDSMMMRLIGRALDVLGVLDAKHFMERYSTTLGFCVYVPFELDDDRRITTLAHELQHVEQYIRDPLMQGKYLASASERTVFEVEAWTTSMEVAKAMGLAVPEVEDICRSLRAYMLSDDDIATARAALTSARATVMLGGVRTPAGKETIAWLGDRC
jgi:hypothetical protein